MAEQPGTLNKAHKARIYGQESNFTDYLKPIHTHPCFFSLFSPSLSLSLSLYSPTPTHSLILIFYTHMDRDNKVLDSGLKCEASDLKLILVDLLFSLKLLSHYMGFY